MNRFIQKLLTEGVATTGELRWDGAEDAIAAIDDATRRDAPGRLPVVDLDAAKWAFCQLHAASRLSVDRSIRESELGRELSEASILIGEVRVRPTPPSGPGPGVAYSVDLAFRYLPDLHRLVERRLRDDPLLREIRHLTREWPLSSIGVPDVEVPRERLDTLRRDPALRRVYIDRVIDRRDATRLDVAWVRDGVLAAFGAALPVPPDFAKALAAR